MIRAVSSRDRVAGARVITCGLHCDHCRAMLASRICPGELTAWDMGALRAAAGSTLVTRPNPRGKGPELELCQPCAVKE